MGALRSWTMLMGLVIIGTLSILSNNASGQSSAAGGGQLSVKEIDVAPETFSLGDAAPDWAEEVEMPSVNGIDETAFRLADSQFHVSDAPAVYVRRALIVKDVASLGAAGQLSFSFIPDYQRLHLHRVQIHRGQDVIDKTATSIRFLQRETGFEQGVYSGAVTAAMVISDLRVGDTLEYAYTLYGQNPVFGGKFVDAAIWDGTYPTRLRRVILTHPDDRTINWRFYSSDQTLPVKPTTTNADGRTRLVFEQRSIPGIAPEALTPNDYVAFRWIDFSEFSDWTEVSAWAKGLFQSKPQSTTSDEMRQAVEPLRALASDNDKVAHALEFVQSEIRYFSVALGESSHRPRPPETVLEQRYGDCKDKTLLLIAMLKELDIDSDPVLLKIGSGNWLEKALPSPIVFDHAIVRVTVDGRDYYLDPTRLGQHGRLDRMGQIHEGTQVLAVTPDAAAIEMIVTPNIAELVRSEVAEILTISKLGEAGQLKFKQTWHGVGAEGIRVTRTFVPQSQVTQSLTSAMEQRYLGAKLVGEPLIEDDTRRNSITLTATYDIPTPAIERNGNWVIPYMPSNMQGALPVKAAVSRQAPLALPSYPYRAVYSFEAHLPEVVSAVRDPMEQSVKNDIFTFDFRSSFRGNVAIAEVDLNLHQDRIETDETAKFVKDVQSLGNSGLGGIVIFKDDIHSGVAAASSFPDILRARIEEAIEKITETIESGRVKGDDLAGAYISRSNNYEYLDKVDEALADAEMSIKLSPNLWQAHACRGSVYLRRREYEKSIADFSKAIILGDTTTESLKLRGIAKFYAGQLEQAAKDFSQSLAIGNVDDQIYSALWLAWTHKRMQKPLPEQIAKYAGESGKTSWPRPALAMFAGKITPDELLAGLESKNGDERHMTLTEGYFYVGQYYMAQDDHEMARRYFQKTLDMNVVPYIEHFTAAIELDQLQAK